ncbi:unnamed protein product [Ectocarpus sp. 12 AP-2014]
MHPLAFAHIINGQQGGDDFFAPNTLTPKKLTVQTVLTNCPQKPRHPIVTQCFYIRTIYIHRPCLPSASPALAHLNDQGEKIILALIIRNSHKIGKSTVRYLLTPANGCLCWFTPWNTEDA